MRQLSLAQHARLDKLAKTRPEAKVIGWAKQGGPVVRDGDYHRWVKPDGRVAMVSQEIMEDVRTARALLSPGSTARWSGESEALSALQEALQAQPLQALREGSEEA